MNITRKLRTFHWQMSAFGLSPSRLRLRLFGNGPRVICTSIPKAGTNLAIRLLCLHPQLYRRLHRTVDDASFVPATLDQLMSRLRPGQTIASHMRFSNELAEVLSSGGYKHIYVTRDPRDLAISIVHYVMREKSHYLHSAFASLANFDDRLKLAICGSKDAGLQPIGERYDASAGWLDSGAVVVRFEDLVGKRGGGCDQSQRESVLRVFKHLQVDASDTIVDSTCEQLFSSQTRTFRKGTLRQWEGDYSAESVILFKENCGEQLVRYGYETDLNW